MRLFKLFPFPFCFKASSFSSSFSSCCRCVGCLCELSAGFGLIKCGKCGQIQPPPPTQATPTCCPDYYSLLVPHAKSRVFGIDLRELKREYLKLQAQVHPDRMQGSVGASWSSWINRANETLRNPLQRAIYLVNLHEREGIKDDEEIVNASSDVHDISLVLEVRESIADSSDNPSVLAELKRENDVRIADCCKELEELLDKGNTDYGAVKRCINRLRYWMGVDEELKQRV